MRPAHIACFFCALSCLAFTPNTASGQPAVHHVPFDISEGRATDYAYHWSHNRDAIAVDFYNRLEVFDMQTMTRMVDLGPPTAGAWVLLGWEPDNEALLLTRFASGALTPRRYPVTIYDVAHASFGTWLPQSRAMQKGAWSPDGRYVALTGLFSGIRVYDARTTKLMFEFGREGSMGQELAWSPDSEAIAAVRVMPDYTERVVIAEISARHAVSRTLHESGATSVLAWSPDGRHVLTSVDVGRGIRVLGRDGTVRCEMTHPGYVMDAAWSHRGDWFATATVDGGVVISRGDDCSAAAQFTDEAQMPSTLAWAPGHDTLAVGGSALQLWNMPEARLLWSLPADVDDIAWSADGTYIAWKVPDQGVYLMAMEAVGRHLRTRTAAEPWRVPDSARVSTIGWSKTRLRLHMAGKPGLTTVDIGALAAPAP